MHSCAESLALQCLSLHLDLEYLCATYLNFYSKDKTPCKNHQKLLFYEIREAWVEFINDSVHFIPQVIIYRTDTAHEIDFILDTVA